MKNIEDWIYLVELQMLLNVKEILYVDFGNTEDSIKRGNTRYIIYLTKETTDEDGERENYIAVAGDKDKAIVREYFKPVIEYCNTIEQIESKQKNSSPIYKGMS
ncbi:MAG: hypothetical protein QNJ38_01455 [Prochloraceae cyanobacterium]|nr:hypothetical protein [Prochloraceae cyanobacterium]